MERSESSRQRLRYDELEWRFMEPQLSILMANFGEQPADWSHLFGLAQVAERVGIDRVAVSEHTLYGERLDAYGQPELGGSVGGKQPTTPDGHWLDPLIVLTTLAATTSRVRLATGILLAALRAPSVLAKELATIDLVSGGRLDVGVGVGWQREEYEACGLSFEGRGALLDRTLMLCQRLWREQVVDFDDAQLRYERIHSMPKPLQPGGVPIWVSGRATARTARRVAEFGVAWIPWGDDIADPIPGIAAMRAAFAAAGRDPATLQVQGVLPIVRRERVIQLDESMAGVSRLVAAGVTDFRIPGRWGYDLAADEAQLGEIVSAFRQAVGRDAQAPAP